MKRLKKGIVLSALLGVVSTCISTTTTTVCCPLLSTTTLPKRAPSNVSQFQQCTILQRVSSTCPTDGYVFCTSAPETNPTLMQIEFFNSAGQVVRNVTGAPPTLIVKVYCVNGVWNVRSSATSSVNIPIASVSCAQSGSRGTDAGYVPGSATN
ncbi:hypothetical protein V3C99_005290 [Haemonchus contortus]|uniref:C6 domain-containing protein n=1 Tax=Haemonchus contortus TaxID=6289 RepID=A0A7I5E5P2_HAECO|nr:Protein C14A4.9 [Haemonchus contortus]